MSPTQTPSPEQTADSADALGEIVARPSGRYRLKFIIFGVVCLALAGWFGYDGFVRYPQENRREVEKGNKPPHNDLNILTQKFLFAALIPAGLYIIVSTLYKTRGTVRLRGEILSIPGHDPIPLGSITEIDLTRWDRKGIAIVTYHTASGESRKFRLDDFWYERPPIDRIQERLCEVLGVESESKQGNDAGETDAGDGKAQDAAKRPESSAEADSEGGTRG